MYENLNNYRAFYTVAQTGNISKASDILFISQPAISKSISNLEAGIGVQLFERTSKGVKLTDNGAILYEHLSRAFDSINQGEDEVKRMNSLGIGQLRIGVSSALCKHILLDYLQEFISDNPHINLQIDCHSTINTIQIIQEGKIDIGLICGTKIPHGFIYKELANIHDIFVSAPSYLNNLKLRELEQPEKKEESTWLPSGSIAQIIYSGSASSSEVRSNDVFSTKELIEKSNLMLLEKKNITRTHIDNYMDEQNIHPNQILEINNMDLLIDFVSIGMGVASVVKEFASNHIESGQIVELPLDNPIPARTAGFIYKDTKNKLPALEKFLSLCGIS